jgi:hypothetical protein
MHVAMQISVRTHPEEAETSISTGFCAWKLALERTGDNSPEFPLTLCRYVPM